MACLLLERKSAQRSLPDLILGMTEKGILSLRAPEEGYHHLSAAAQTIIGPQVCWQQRCILSMGDCLQTTA